MADEARSTPAVPHPVMGLYDRPFWESARARRLALQRCTGCGAFRYPPGPVCPVCLSDACDWTPVSGGATLLSWAVFHRQYLPAYPPPYNVIAVRLDEGPVMISNLEGEPPAGEWIGRRVRLIYADTPGGLVLPRFVLDEAASAPDAVGDRGDQ